MTWTGFHIGNVLWRVNEENKKSMVELMRADVKPPADASEIRQKEVEILKEYTPTYYSAPKLGEGTYGAVYGCVQRPDVAVKMFKKKFPKQPWMKLMMSVLYGPTPFEPGEPWRFASTADYEKTAGMLQSLAAIPGYAHVHPILHYDENQGVLITPLCRGNLFTLGPKIVLETMTPTWRKLATDICSAVTYMHACDVCHLDIKPGNIFWKGNKPADVQFFLSDFDLAVENTCTAGLYGTDLYMFKPFMERWQPGIYPDDADRYALCKTLTKRFNTGLLRSSNPLMQSMLGIMNTLDKEAVDEDAYMHKIETMHEAVSREMANLLVLLGLPSLDDIRAQREAAVAPKASPSFLDDAPPLRKRGPSSSFESGVKRFK